MITADAVSISTCMASLVHHIGSFCTAASPVASLFGSGWNVAYHRLGGVSDL